MNGRRDFISAARLMALSLSLVAPACWATTYSLIIGGLGGEREYEQRFREQVQQLALASRSLTGESASTRVLVGPDATRESVRRELQWLAANTSADDQIIITLIGHGSFDGDQYRFNLPGPDMTGAELEALFDRLPSRSQLIVNATSASGAALDHWKRDHRIVITATKSGGEKTATRFAQQWVDALTRSDADINKNDIITVAEAFDYTTRKVADSFKSDALLATEHARMEGSGAGQFQVARLGPAARVSTDPELNEMYAQRVRIERELDAVKERKADLATDAYYDELEGVLVKLALLQRQIDAHQPGTSQ